MKISCLPLLFFIGTCFQTIPSDTKTTTEAPQPAPDSLLCQRFSPPQGYERVTADSSAFAHYLRYLPLKPVGSKVLLHDGREKSNSGVYDAVVDMPIGKKDLHQCADAIIRLRAEYLWRKGRYRDIHFNLTNGFRVDYERWRKGERVKVTGNRTSWEQKSAPSDSYETFWQYLELVFTYAGTLSLSKEMQAVDVATMQIGDVFIQGGSPGHAVIVVDMATNEAGQKVFLLAQSYMPAQEIQVLKNSSDGRLSPWYSADFGEVLETPEWKFRRSDLKRFVGE
ncbi:MAG: DUF4846 domain-containing protein [Saprospiraceae bacterium]|nr:DUF4846 domain-containing protein [Saprospiraceae bacterium]